MQRTISAKPWCWLVLIIPPQLEKTPILMFYFLLWRVQTQIKETNNSEKHPLRSTYQTLKGLSTTYYRLDGWKGAFFQVQGPVQGPREEVQGPCARATIPINRNGCKGHLDMCKGHKKRCKGLWCVQGPHIMSLYQNTNLVQGPHLLPFKVLEHT